MPQKPTRTVLFVFGMRDNGCRERMTKALEAIQGVQVVEVNLFRARATVIHDPACGLAELIEAVERIGCRALPVLENSRHAAPSKETEHRDDRSIERTSNGPEEDST